MFERLRAWILQILRVAPTPHPPAGAPGSVRAFRAASNFYKLRLLVWGAAQVAALAGLVFSLWFFSAVRRQIEADRQVREGEPAVEAPVATETPQPLNGNLARLAARTPIAAIAIVLLLESFAVLAFLVALPVTYAAVRLDYELRWYIVTDRSLRIRTGLFNMQEMTMSFANLQQVVVSQGPLQRLLGIADVQVRSAGGGGGGEGHHKRTADSTHIGIFHGVDNATEIRDLILERLRRFRETGLGDPDDTLAHFPSDAKSADAVSAAVTVLAEARALRQTIECLPA